MEGITKLKHTLIGTLIAMSLASLALAADPVAGTTTVGVTVTEMQSIIKGYSAHKDLIGKSVMNDHNDKVGKIDDVIIMPDNTGGYAIVGVGGFLGMGKKDVIIPLAQLKVEQRHVTLTGATKDALKALPPFEYAKKG